MVSTYWLNVPQEEASKAKELRCRWDSYKRRWWKPAYVSMMVLPKHWIPTDLVESIHVKARKGRIASSRTNSAKIWDTELNIVYPSMRCLQDELNITYKQVKDLIASGRYKKI